MDRFRAAVVGDAESPHFRVCNENERKSDMSNAIFITKFIAFDCVSHKKVIKPNDIKK